MRKIKLNLLMLLGVLLGFSHYAKAVAETEPNNLWNQANAISLGATGTGTCTATGDADWWRVTSTVDGQLTVNFTSTNGIYLYCQVYDTLGTIAFSTNIYTSGSAVVNVDGLAAGTYYIQFFAYNSTTTPTYSFVPTWTTPAQVIDAEPNDKKTQAKTLALNGSVTGHVSYYFNNKRDSIDWWKVTTNKDGQLNFTITSGNGNYVYAQLYDNDGVTFLAGSYTNGTATYAKDGLAVGTYYIAVFAYSINNFAPYTLSNTLTLPPCVIDAEPNGTKAQALTINLNDSLVGHVSYYYNHYRDTLDWYKVTTTLEGQLNYKIASLNGNYVYLQLFDNDGVTLLGGSYTNGTQTFNTDGLAAGTYYLAVFSYNQNDFEPYSIKVTQTLPPVTIDAEPNGTRALATTINPNDSIVGHLSYYYNHGRDTLDFRKITLTTTGRLDWTVSSQNGNYIYAQLLDNNATTLLGGSYTNGTSTFSVDGLNPGTYYLLLQAYSVNSFVPYYLKTSFTPTPTDLEPNGTYATAAALTLNDSLNGNVSYYYNAERDTADWFKLATNNDGQLNIKIYSLNSAYIYLTVYDNNGSTILYQAYTNSTLSYSRNDLAKGTYYIKVEAYSINTYVRYALVNSLVNNNPNDGEPNGYAKQGKVISGYSTKPGNINYYYNGVRDTNDWFKIAYYGGGLNININKVQHTFDANYPDITYKLYKDTNATPIDNQNLTGAGPFAFSYTTGLTSGATYYIKMSQLNNTFGGYTINAQYRDTTSQLVSRITAISDTSCGLGQLTYTIYRGKAPYSVQLYKDGIAYGSPVVTPDTAKFTLLDAGYYSVSTNSTLAVTTFVWGKDTALVPQVQGAAATSITATSAIAKWTNLPCADGYKFQWRLKGATGWTTIILKKGVPQDTLTGLVASTQYQFRVYAYTVYNSLKYFSKVTATVTFKTTAVRMGNELMDNTVADAITVSPNPATDFIQFELPTASDKIVVTVTNTIGQTIKSIEINNATDVNQSINISTLKTGVYMLTIDANGTRQYARFVKE